MYQFILWKKVFHSSTYWDSFSVLLMPTISHKVSTEQRLLLWIFICCHDHFSKTTSRFEMFGTLLRITFGKIYIGSNTLFLNISNYTWREARERLNSSKINGERMCIKDFIWQNFEALCQELCFSTHEHRILVGYISWY